MLDLQAPEHGSDMQQIALAGQQLAYRFLHTRAKAMYVRRAIMRYNKLFKVRPRTPLTDIIPENGLHQNLWS